VERVTTKCRVIEEVADLEIEEVVETEEASAIEVEIVEVVAQEHKEVAEEEGKSNNFKNKFLAVHLRKQIINDKFYVTAKKIEA
jgi:hypothetical protein